MEQKLDLYIKEIIDNVEQADISDYWKVLCVTRGIINVTKGSQVHKLSKGDVMLFAPDEFHYICNQDMAEFIFIAFDGSGELLFNLSSKAVSLSQEEIKLIENADKLRENTENAISVKKVHTMIELFILLCCEKEGIKTCKVDNAGLFTFAADLLKQNITSNISVAELAERVDVSISNLKRIFLKFTGIGVHEYYTILKIALAKELLQSGNSVTATASLTGFANQAYFSAAFKRVTGKSPKEYSSVKLKTRKSPIEKAINKTQKSDLPDYLL